MRFWKRLNNRSRILVLLLALLVLLNSIVLVTTYNLKSFSGSFASMLNDRLIPSTDIAHIQEHCFKNRLFLEDMVFSHKHNHVAKKIGRYNQRIDSTYKKYQHTYFTKEERAHANKFLEALQEYRGDEQRILKFLEQGDKQKAEALFEGESQQAFQRMIQELNLLSGIQLSVGQLLYEHAGDNIRLIKLVAYFSLFISLIIVAQLLKVLGIKPR